MLPVVTMLGMDLAIALGGSLFVETVYCLPGLGRVAATSLARRDLPVLLGIGTYTTLAVIAVNFVIDVLYGLIDPRARMGRETEGRAAPVLDRERMPTSATQPAT